MIGAAAVFNIALLVMGVVVMGRYGLPNSGGAITLVLLAVIAPAASLIALWRSETRETVSWLLLELRARKATLQKRIASEVEGDRNVQ